MDEHAESACFVWARWTIACSLGLLVAMVVVLTLCSCKTERTEKEQTVEQEKIRVTGTVAGMPSDLTVTRDRTERRQEQVVGKGGIDAQMVGDLASAASGGLLSALLPGLGGLATGLIPAAMAWLKAKGATKALEQTVHGLEEAKSVLPQEAQDRLHSALSKHMDVASKQKVRSIKAKGTSV